MPLRFIIIQYLLYLFKKYAVYFRQPFRQILMHSRFAYSEFVGCASDCCTVFYHIKGESFSPSFNTLIDSATLPYAGIICGTLRTNYLLKFLGEVLFEFHFLVSE